MANYLVQAGTALFTVNRVTGVATPVTLPPGITLNGMVRSAFFNQNTITSNPVAVVVNGGTHDFWIDNLLVARPLQIAAPVAAPTLAAGTGTGLSGVYVVGVTFKNKDAVTGATLMESALSPVSLASPTLANTSLALTNIPVSGDSVVNARGLYRSLSGGNVLYPWFDLDDNTTVSDDRDVADSLLSILPTTVTSNGSPPDLSLCVEWKNRLWGVPRINFDLLQWTEERLFYAWNPANSIPVPPVQDDNFGVTALIPRRDQLGVARRAYLHQISGDTNDTFARAETSESLGCVSQESVVIIKNVAYFLGERGVNEWSDLGVRCVSDAQVSQWFLTDTFFNRSLFNLAQGRYNQETDSYELLLVGAGQVTLNRWISYCLKTRTWYGPHLTNAFTPSSTASNTQKWGILHDANALPISVFGGTDGNLYKRDQSQVNDNGIAVPLSIQTPFVHAGEPDFDKMWDRPTIHTRSETQGQLYITPIVGDLNSPNDPVMPHDLTLDREVLDRLGQGRYCSLILTHSSTGERPRLFGIELPYNYVGRR